MSRWLTVWVQQLQSELIWSPCCPSSARPFRPRTDHLPYFNLFFLFLSQFCQKLISAAFCFCVLYRWLRNLWLQGTVLLCGEWISPDRRTAVSSLYKLLSVSLEGLGRAVVTCVCRTWWSMLPHEVWTAPAHGLLLCARLLQMFRSPKDCSPRWRCDQRWRSRTKRRAELLQHSTRHKTTAKHMKNRHKCTTKMQNMT